MFFVPPAFALKVERLDLYCGVVPDESGIPESIDPRFSTANEIVFIKDSGTVGDEQDADSMAFCTRFP